MTEAGAPVRKVHWLVKVFVFFHAFMVLIWCLPATTDEIANRIEKGSKNPSDLILYYSNGYLKDRDRLWTRYMSSTGLWQYWDMFSPNPAQVDYWLDAEVEFADGSKKIHQYPRIKDLSLTQKYIKERYRKYTERSANDDPSSRRRFPAFAQRIALEAAHDPKNLPVEVRLRRHWRRILPPGQQTPEGYQTATYFEYVVDQAKLRGDKGW